MIRIEHVLELVRAWRYALNTLCDRPGSVLVRGTPLRTRARIAWAMFRGEPLTVSAKP